MEVFKRRLDGTLKVVLASMVFRVTDLIVIRTPFG
jgi:hypothetical protein